MLQRAGFLTWVGGNVGRSLVDRVHDMTASDSVVMELSSFQLELMTVSPEVAAVLNVTPNHLDRHKTMLAYKLAKQRILDFQSETDFALLSCDDPGSRDLASAVRGRLAFFGSRSVNGNGGSSKGDMEIGAFLRGGFVTLRLDGQERVICRSDDIQLLGRHNVLNVLAACALAGAVGVPVEVMREVATNFTGVEHRLQYVRTLNGVRYYDDSIATTPERSFAGP
jgi:UDP-N-acetylmuramoylalanine--D-glutamate ligase